MKTYTTRSGLTQYKPSLRQIESTMRNDNATGFCLACGQAQDGVEPDGRKYKCEACGAHKVYGAEELLAMNLFH